MNKSGCKDPTAETAVKNVMKEWREVSDKERIKTKKEKCRYCKYAARSNGGSHTNIDAIVCDYLAITKQRRGCSPINCEKFERKTKRKRGAR